MRIPKISLFLVVTGFLIPLVFLPLAKGKENDGDIFANLLNARVQLVAAQNKPVFLKVKKGEANPSAQVVQFEETQLFMEFGKTATITEIGRAVKARFPDDKLLPGDPDSGRMRFDGWKVRKAVSFSFRYAIATGLLLALLGMVLAFKAPRT